MRVRRKIEHLIGGAETRVSKVCQPLVPISIVRLKGAKARVESSEGLEARLDLMASSTAGEETLSRGSRHTRSGSGGGPGVESSITGRVAGVIRIVKCAGEGDRSGRVVVGGGWMDQNGDSRS